MIRSLTWYSCGEVMEARILDSLLVFLMFVMSSTFLMLRVSSNAEGDVLNQLKLNLADPNNVMHSWNATDANPCRWYHVTCNSYDSVTRLDLGNANLSGQLIPQLGQLENLQYLELYSNNLSGRIPEELGNLTNLVSLELFLNRLSGPIPDTLGKLEKLRFLRLHNNTLTGTIPMSLTNIVTLQVLDLSNNRLTGDIPVNGSFSLFTPSSLPYNSPNAIPVSTPPISYLDSSDSGAIARGVPATVALLFVTLAIVIP